MNREKYGGYQDEQFEMDFSRAQSAQDSETKNDSKKKSATAEMDEAHDVEQVELNDLIVGVNREISQEDEKIFNQIRSGDIRNIVNLTVIYPDIAGVLAASDGLIASEFMPAKELSEYSEHFESLRILPLDNLKSIDDVSVERLSHFEGALSFWNLEDISDQALEILYRTGWPVFLQEPLKSRLLKISGEHPIETLYED